MKDFRQIRAAIHLKAYWLLLPKVPFTASDISHCYDAASHRSEIIDKAQSINDPMKINSNPITSHHILHEDGCLPFTSSTV
eukprot:scaffold72830_cov25-Prasinocladus_malaysianus.AAC.1